MRREGYEFEVTANPSRSLRVTANYGMDVGLRTLGNRYSVLGSCGRAPEAPRRVQLDLRAELGRENSKVFDAAEREIAAIGREGHAGHRKGVSGERMHHLTGLGIPQPRCLGFGTDQFWGSAQ